MRLMIFCSLLVSLCSMAQQDPFSQRQRHATSSPPVQPVQVEQACHQDKPKVAENVPFNQLKLVGIVLLKNQPETLWLNEQQVLSVALNSTMASEGLLVEQITKQEVRLVDCQQSQPIRIKF